MEEGEERVERWEGDGGREGWKKGEKREGWAAGLFQGVSVYYCHAKTKEQKKWRAEKKAVAYMYIHTITCMRLCSH